jgi:signal transduction histidine kinase
MQEALLNATRHARAAEIQVRLLQDGASIVLEVIDDGIGVESSQAQLHASCHGLLTMRERALHAGGSLAIGPGADGRGTTIRALLPCVETPDPNSN